MRLIGGRNSNEGCPKNPQPNDLTAAAQRHGWRVVADFVDEGISGAKGRDQRTAFDQLCRYQFDVIAAWSVACLGRSLQDLVSFLDEVHGAGVWRVWRVRTRDDRAAGSCRYRQGLGAGHQKRKGHRTAPRCLLRRSLLYGLRSSPETVSARSPEPLGSGTARCRTSRGRCGRSEAERRVAAI
jgi:hypothetical protein